MTEWDPSLSNYVKVCIALPYLTQYDLIMLLYLSCLLVLLKSCNVLIFHIYYQTPYEVVNDVGHLELDYLCQFQVRRVVLDTFIYILKGKVLFYMLNMLK